MTRPMTAGAVFGTTSTREGDDWRERAACRDEDPEMWFASTVSKDPEERADAAHAKAICHACPVSQQCLDLAIDERIPYGIFGGLTEGERRRRGTTAKVPVCGGPGGRTLHEDEGTPICGTCLTYENGLRVKADLRRWERAAPLIARGLTNAQAGAHLGVTEESIRRARNAAQRHATQAA